MRSYKRTTTAIVGGADDDGIAQDQNITAATAMTLNGAIGATLSPPRRVQIKSGADVSAATFVVTGYDRAGLLISESIAGPNVATTTGNKVFARITSIVPSASVASNVRVGFSAEVIGAWMPIGQLHTNGAWQAIISGTVTYSIQRTYRNILREGINGDYETEATDLQASGSASTAGVIEGGVGAIRINQSAGTGGVTLRFIPAEGK